MKNTFKILSFRKHLYKENTYVFYGFYPHGDDAGKSISCYVNKKEVPVQLTINEGNEVRRRYMAMEKNISKEYVGQFTIADSLPKVIEIFTRFDAAGESSEKKSSYILKGQKIKELDNKTKLHLEGAAHDGDKIRIMGWCVAAGQIELQVLSGEKRLDAEVKWSKRADVQGFYPEFEGNAGFEIAIENRNYGDLTIRIIEKTENQNEKILLEQPLDVNIVNNGGNFIYKPSYTERVRNYLYMNGLGQTVKRVFTKAKGVENPYTYADFLEAFGTKEEELQRQREDKNIFTLKFSIVVPMYNTKPEYLKALIESVANQTYANWELCLADGSEISNEEFIRDLCDKLKLSYNNQVKYQHLSENRGISENTNAALAMAKGEFIAFCDHDDLLAPDALYENAKVLTKKPAIEMLYSDEDKVTMDGKTFFDPAFKPDFSIDYLCSVNYICHLLVVSRTLLDKVPAFDSAYDGAQDHDFILRCAEQAKCIYHIPKVLYHWRAHNDSTAMAAANKMYAYENGAKAVSDHYARIGVPAKAKPYEFLGTYKTTYEWPSQSLVSIIIPNKDNVEMLSKCLESIEKTNTCRNYEIIIVENNSTDEKTFEYYKTLKKCKVVYYTGSFNYSAINNFGRKHASGEYLLLLNNDITVINDDAISQMLDVCMRNDVGAVGAQLFYPDDTVQHGGIIMGVGGIAGHSFVTFKRGEPGYMFRLALPNDVSACTAAALMVKASVYDEVGGLTEELSVAFNDVDLCLKIRQVGYLIVYNPFAMFYHYESASRGMENTIEKRERFNREIAYLEENWNELLIQGDPYYNPNLSLKNGSYLLKE